MEQYLEDLDKFLPQEGSEVERGFRGIISEAGPPWSAMRFRDEDSISSAEQCGEVAHLHLATHGLRTEERLRVPLDDRKIASVFVGIAPSANRKRRLWASRR